MSSSRIVVVTVHGTNDTGDREGAKWWQRGSSFTEKLRAAIRPTGEATVEIEPYLWTGANSAFDREQAGAWLADFLRQLRQDHDEIHIVAHSHGGNVVTTACDRLGWAGDQAKQKVHSVTAVGTPFLRGRSGFLYVIVAAILALAALTAIGVASARYAIYYAATAEERASILGGGGNTDVYYLFVIASAVFVFTIALRLWRRFRAGLARAVAGPRLLALWHPNDEAISFLRQVHETKIEPFPPGALLRATRGNAVLAGAVAVVSLTLMARFDVGLGAAIQAMNPLSTLFIDASHLGDIAVMAPAAFLAGYWAYRIVAGALPELLLRRRLNASMGGILRGLAIGADTDARFEAPQNAPRGERCAKIELNGAVAERMREHASGRTDELLRKYRDAIFSVDQDARPVFARIAEDALTWDSLIHTTYFDQPEIIAAIAAHVRGAGARGA